MIGGEDIEIQIIGPSDVIMRAAVKAIMAYWPKAVFEDVREGEVMAAYEAVSFSQLDDLFVYRDPAAFESWLRLGADSSNVNTMIHLLHGPDGLTVVTDDAQEPHMRAIIQSVRTALRDALRDPGRDVRTHRRLA